MANVKTSVEELKNNVINIADYLKQEKPPEAKSFYIKIKTDRKTLERLHYWRSLSPSEDGMRTVVIIAKANISKWLLFKMYWLLFFEQIKKIK